MPYDRPHAAAAGTQQWQQQDAALARAAQDVAEATARLTSARNAQRDVLVRCVQDHKWPVSLAADVARVSRETAHKWLRA